MYKHLLLLLATVIALQVAAQKQSKQYFHFTRYTQANGLSSTSVNCTYQDAQGFIWIGTADHLERFDGSKFVYMLARGTHAMPNDAITQIVGVNDSMLLLNYGVLREFGIFNTKSYTYTPVKIVHKQALWPRADYVVQTDHRGNVFLRITRYANILIYNKNKFQFEELGPVKAPYNWTISSLFIDTATNRYWLSCDSGLAVYDVATKRVYSKHYNPMGWKVLAQKRMNEANVVMHIDDKRRYWVVNWPVYGGGAPVLHCYDAEKNIYLKDTAGWAASAIRYREVNSITETKDGIIWFYGLNTLLSYLPFEKGIALHYSKHLDSYGIRYESVRHVMEDKEHGIWVSTDDGLYYAAAINYNLLNIGLSDGLEATAITPIADSTFLLNTWGSGVKLIQLKQNDLSIQNITNEKQHRNLAMNWCAAFVNTQEIWIGAQFGWLGIYNVAKQQLQEKYIPATQGKTIRSVLKAKNGIVYLGTQGGSIIKYVGNSFTPIFQCGTIIYQILEDRQGYLWVATHDKGLYRIDGQSGKILKHYTKAATAGLYANVIKQIDWLNDNTLAIANNKLSLLNIQTEQFQHIGVEQGLPSNSITTFQIDHQQRVWLITAQGLCSYDIRNNSFAKYSGKDGVIDPQKFIASTNIARTSIAFGGTNRLLIFTPAAFANKVQLPAVTITDFRINNRYYLVDSLLAHRIITLHSDQNSIGISFAALSYQQVDKLRYYYRLKGYDSTWRMSNNALLLARYDYLPSGKYTFEVQARSNDGISTTAVTSIPIEVAPPFWKTGWFFSTILFFVTLLLYLIHSLRVKRLLDVEKLRNRVARDLHDDMGSTLSTINILSAMAKAKMQTDPVKTAEFIKKISENSQRMMEAMDDIVWAIKPANDSMEKIVARMREFATSVLEAKDVDIHFEVEEAVLSIRLNMEQRRDIFLVVKEAVNNIAKYASASSVHIDIKLQNGKLRIVVADDGVGFDVASADTGNGLGNMQKRMQGLAGKCVIESSKGNGTTLIFLIPLV